MPPLTTTLAEHHTQEKSDILINYVSQAGLVSTFLVIYCSPLFPGGTPPTNETVKKQGLQFARAR